MPHFSSAASDGVPAGVVILTFKSVLSSSVSHLKSGVGGEACKISQYNHSGCNVGPSERGVFLSHQDTR